MLLDEHDNASESSDSESVDRLQRLPARQSESPAVSMDFLSKQATPATGADETPGTHRFVGTVDVSGEPYSALFSTDLN